MNDPLILREGLDCGVVMTAQQRDQVMAVARRVEASGFDSIWVGDHISFYVPILESLTLLSFVAGVTERVRLGSGVYLLPLRHPTITAKVAATLDVLSGGRLDLGVGVGGEFPPEFEASGVPVWFRTAQVASESVEAAARAHDLKLREVAKNPAFASKPVPGVPGALWSEHDGLHWAFLPGWPRVREVSWRDESCSDEGVVKVLAQLAAATPPPPGARRLGLLPKARTPEAG